MPSEVGGKIIATLLSVDDVEQLAEVGIVKFIDTQTERVMHSASSNREQTV
ncbi:MAG: hypothetical protein WBA12_07395 [Catalinimonas sp.]